MGIRLDEGRMENLPSHTKANKANIDGIRHADILNACVAHILCAAFDFAFFPAQKTVCAILTRQRYNPLSAHSPQGAVSSCRK